MNGSRRPAGRADLCVGRSPLILRFGHVAEFESLRITPLVRRAGPEPCEEKLQQCAIHTMRRRLGSYSHAEARRRRGCLDRINGMNSWNVANVEVLPVANANCVVGCRITTRPNESTIKMFRRGTPAKFPFAPRIRTRWFQKKIEKLSVCRKKMLKSNERACQTHVKR